MKKLKILVGIAILSTSHQLFRYFMRIFLKLSGRVEELDKLKESLQTEIDSLVVSYEKVV